MVFELYNLLILLIPAIYGPGITDHLQIAILLAFDLAADPTYPQRESILIEITIETNLYKRSSFGH